MLAFLPGCGDEAKTARKLDAAQEHFRSKRYPAAEIEFKNVLTLQPGHPVALKSLGLIWVSQGKMLDGANILSSARQQLPEDDEVAVHLAHAMLDLGAIASGREVLLEVLERSPANGEALILLAESSMTPELMAETEARITKTMATDQASVMLASALLQMRQGMLDQGTATVERVLEIEPDNSRAHTLRGTLHLAHSKPEEALKSMKRGADLAGYRSPEIGRYANLLMGLKRRDEAVTLLEEATAAAPDYLPNWRLLGEIAYSENNDTEAAEHLSKVLAMSPLDIEANLLMAHALIRSDDGAGAVKLLERIAERFPSRPGIELNLAKAYLAAGDFRRANEMLDSVLTAVPGASEAILLRSELHLRDGEPEAALRIIEPMIEADPSNRKAQDLLIHAASATNRMDDAMTLLRKQSESEDDPIPLFKMGRLHLSQGKNKEAREAFERASALSPDSVSLLSQFTALDHIEGKTDEAMERLDEYLGRHPESAEGYLLKGGLQFTINDTEGAEKSLNRSVSIRPAATPHLLLVKILTESGRMEEAADQLARFLVSEPAQRPIVYLELGNMLMRLKRHEEARDWFGKLVALHPDYAPAHNNLAHIHSELLVDLDKAYASASRARELSPRDPSISDTMGRIEWLKGNYSKALPFFQEAITGLPGLPTVHYHLAMNHYMMGNSDEATDGLEQALALDAAFPEKSDAERRLAILRSEEDDPGILENRVRENPDDVVVLLQYARSLTKAGRFADALAAYDQALAANPDLEAAHLGRADLFSEHLDDPAKALEAANQASRVAPSSALTLAAQGRAHFANGNHEEAYGLLKEASSNTTAGTAPLVDFAWAAYSLGRIEEARTAMERGSSETEEAIEFLALTSPERLQNPATRRLAETVLNRQPDHVPALMLLAETRDRAGENAEESFLRILTIYPKFDTARKALAAAYLKDPARIDEAEALVNEARRRLPEDTDLTGIMGMISFRKGNHEAAIQFLSEVATQRPLQASELFALGMSQAALKRTDSARASLTQAIKAGLAEPDTTEAKNALEALDKEDE
jgi:tetratricopeptide (TPR) repeat protein